jgi:hypothetical protein
LLFSGEVSRDCAFDHGPGQATTFRLQFANSSFRPGNLRLGLFALMLQLNLEALPNVVAFVRLKSYLGVIEALDGLFDLLDAVVTLRAVRSLHLSPYAVEVVVGTLRSGETQPVTAVGAEDRALQVVMVDPSFVPGTVVQSRNLLDAVKEGFRYEGLMASLVLNAHKVDVAQVVAIGEDRRHRRAGDRGGGPLAMGQRPQTFLLQRFSQGGHCPAARGVGLECPLNDGCSPRVDLDHPHFMVNDPASNIAISNRCSTRGAPDLGFESHSREGPGAVVARFVLGEGGEDAVHQHPGRRLINVLFDGHQLAADGSKFEEDVGVITPITRKPVNLVEDDVVDISVRLDSPKHLQESGSVGSLGRLTTIDKDLDHLSIEILSLFQTSVALSWERVPIRVDVFVGLLCG